MKTLIKAPNYLEIEPVPKQIKRPLWSVLIPTYNCAHYLKKTLQSVLAQDLGEDEMEIIVVDDHSTVDNPESVVKAIGKGRVQFIRQTKNVGKVRNYETGLQASKGHFIHQLHGDDMVRPGFYNTMEALFKKHPEVGASFCRSIYIDEQSRWTGMTGILQDQDGIVPDMAEKLYIRQEIQTPAMVVKREVYESIGAFDRRLDCMEDREMWIRIANNYSIAYTNKVQALYRRHEANATNLTYLDGTAFKSHQLVSDIVDSYIKPSIKAKYYKTRKREQTAFWVLSYQYIKTQLSSKQKLQFVRFILAHYPSVKTIYKLIK